jgi:predicted transcriptional regulator
MPKIKWKSWERDLIVENCETMTTKELADLLPGRSEKSINRMIEKLREDGVVGHRSQRVVNRAYRQRERGNGPQPVRHGRIPTDSYVYEPTEEEVLLEEKSLSEKGSEV